MSLRNDLLKLLRENISTDAPLTLAEPKNLDYGDYATNIALRLAKTRQKAPPVIAQELCAALNQKTADFVFTEIHGFINIKIRDACLRRELGRITPDYGRPAAGESPAGQKILLEYVSANPTGPLHIGHGRWAVLGDIIARVLSYCGQQVTKEFYINDAGRQINNFIASVHAVRHGQPPPEDGYHGTYITELAGLDGDPVELMLSRQKADLKNIRAEFDSWFSEKTLHQSGAVERALAALQKQNAVYTRDGALWFKSTDYGDDKDRVLVRSSGEKTYFTADIAYHQDKLDRGFDRLINIWGADHHGYIPRVQAALKALAGQTAPLTVILGQLVNLYRGGEPVKMSKRTGELITLQEVAAEIGVDAVRYFLAMRSADTALDFDLELAKKQSNDNPVYYVQYAHARICSILRQAGAAQGEAASRLRALTAASPELHPAERVLILKIIRLPEELEAVSQSYHIHRLCSYAQELAALFHNFYHECRVISADTATTAARLQIIRATQTVLKIILDLLAVTAPEQM